MSTEPRDPARDDSTPAAVPVEPQSSLREDVLERERRRFGGVKIGSAFFGWLCAVGIAVLLTALVAATGAALGLGATNGGDNAAKLAKQNAGAIGLGGAIALVVIMLIAYYCGGYVAGRMARFNGLRQGFAVWVWAIVIAIVVGIIAAIAGSQFNILERLNGFPRIPVNEGSLSTIGIITAILAVIASLVGALFGGMAGMRFHRRVDRVGLGR